MFGETLRSHHLSLPSWQWKWFILRLAVLVIKLQADHWWNGNYCILDMYFNPFLGKPVLLGHVDWMPRSPYDSACPFRHSHTFMCFFTPLDTFRSIWWINAPSSAQYYRRVMTPETFRICTVHWVSRVLQVQRVKLKLIFTLLSCFHMGDACITAKSIFKKRNPFNPWAIILEL